jgi:transcriptional regulator with XRE-family HTH domain
MIRTLDVNMPPTSLGDRIEQARRAKGFDVAQLARRIAVKAATLRNWESDRSGPRPEKLNRLAGILGVPLIWLLTGETPEAAQAVGGHTEITAFASKLERAVAMQQELASLLIELSADVARLQREFDTQADQAA